MDSLSQIALGAAVSVAVFRRRQPLWQSALIGAVVGTLPDLDVLISHGDPISNMTYHRAESHALFYLTLISPLLAWLWLRMSSSLVPFKTSLLAIWLVLVTHPLLDTLTIYGTQLGLPFTDYPFGIGSVFVIDPLYTVPLLLGTGLVLSGRHLRWNSLGLLLSTAYLGFGLWAQHHVTSLVKAQLPTPNLGAKLLVSATPFNTLLWRALWVDGDRYFEGYYSLLDATSTVNWQSYPRDVALLQQWQQQKAVARLSWFSHGFVSLSLQSKQSTSALLLTDLRMGIEPGYSFRFLLPLDAHQQVSGVPEQLPMATDSRAIGWLYQRALAQTEASLAQFLQQSDVAGR
jgi:inner membrane protein